MLLCLCCVVCMAQKGDRKKYPYVATQKTTNGKYGIPDGKGGWKVQPLFDFLLFGGGEPVGVAEYKNKYYIVDRNLNVISKTATCAHIPTVTPYCVILNNGDQGSYAINFKGERISPVYEELTMHSGSVSKDAFQNYIFFAKEKGDKKYSLLGLDFKKIGKQTFRHNLLLTCFVADTRNGEINFIDPLIEFDGSNGKSGLINWNGDVIIPPIATTCIDGEDLSKWFDDFKVKELRQASTLEQCWRTKIFCPKVDVKKKRAVGYDMAGKVIIPEQKFKHYYHFFKKNMKKYIIPYLRNDKENLRAYQEKVYAPYYNFLSRMEACAKKITTPVGCAYNLVDEITGKNVRKSNAVAQRKTTTNGKGKSTNRQVATKKNNAVRQKYDDATFFDLKGHVKSCVIRKSGKVSKTIHFNQEGFLTFYKNEGSDVYNYSIESVKDHDVDMGVIRKKDEGERVIYFGKVFEDPPVGLSIRKDKDGKLACMSPILTEVNVLNVLVIVVYEYNAKGLIETESGWGIDRHYIYQTFDKHGNWTKRIVKDKDGKEQGIETRTIIYW